MASVWWSNKEIDFGTNTIGFSYKLNAFGSWIDVTYSGIVTLLSVLNDIQSNLNVKPNSLVKSFKNDEFLTFTYVFTTVNEYIRFNDNATSKRVAYYLGLKDDGTINTQNHIAEKWGAARLIIGCSDNVRKQQIGNSANLMPFELEQGVSNRNGDVFKTNGVIRSLSFKFEILNLGIFETLQAIIFFRTLRSGEDVTMTDALFDQLKHIFINKNAQLYEGNPLNEVSDSFFRKNKINFIRVEKVSL